MQVNALRPVAGRQLVGEEEASNRKFFYVLPIYAIILMGTSIFILAKMAHKTSE